MAETVSISEAASLLHVTEKTIRNYIKRGFFEPEKWNGMWQIRKSDIVEISKKKNIKVDSRLEFNAHGEIGLSKNEYSVQMIGLGKLHAYEGLLKEQKEELAKLTERTIQLEASSAAGWTEARSAQAQCESLKLVVDQLKRAESTTKEELVWLRREKDRLAESLSAQIEVSRKQLLRMRELEDQLHIESLFM
jgi:DNA-binding transcriptional MerR regulator